MRNDPQHESNPTAYWQANLGLLRLLLLIWALVSCGLSILFVEPLNQFRLAGFPLGFWFAHQGSMVVFVLLIWVYAYVMDRLDARYRVD